LVVCQDETNFIPQAHSAEKIIATAIKVRLLEATKPLVR
jgi:hypothetical protein